eukprot:UN08330
MLMMSNANETTNVVGNAILDYSRMYILSYQLVQVVKPDD